MLKKLIHYVSIIGILFIANSSFGQLPKLNNFEEPEKITSNLDEPVVYPKNLPESKDLFPFTPSANSKTLEFFIDLKNITPAKDIIQYVVVIKSPEGADQTFYAGIDCNRFMKITYARLDKTTWEDSHDTWRPIGNLGYNNYPAYLGRKALCTGDTATSKVSDVVQRLKDPVVYSAY
jgi:hypothetical protein